MVSEYRYSLQNFSCALEKAEGTPIKYGLPRHMVPAYWVRGFKRSSAVHRTRVATKTEGLATSEDLLILQRLCFLEL